MARRSGKSSPPSREQVRRWMRRGPFRKPQGLRLEEPPSADVLIVSFPVPGTTLGERLTGTETAIAQDVLSGLSNAAIARKRGTSARTIANQVASIFRKLQVRSRLELSLYAWAGRHAPTRQDP